MASVNKVIVIGNLGKDPEIRYTQGGDAVCNFSLACNEKWKDKAGEVQERTEWVRCTAFGRDAENIGEYVKKGQPLYVEGQMRTRKYEKEGVEHYVTEVIVGRFQFLASKPEGERQERSSSAKPAAGKPAPKKNTDDFDDDIPF